jgi:hypothetical protein
MKRIIWCILLFLTAGNVIAKSAILPLNIDDKNTNMWYQYSHLKAGPCTFIHVEHSTSVWVIRAILTLETAKKCFITFGFYKYKKPSNYSEKNMVKLFKELIKRLDLRGYYRYVGSSFASNYIVFAMRSRELSYLQYAFTGTNALTLPHFIEGAIKPITFSIGGYRPEVKTLLIEDDTTFDSLLTGEYTIQ